MRVVLLWELIMWTFHMLPFLMQKRRSLLSRRGFWVPLCESHHRRPCSLLLSRSAPLNHHKNRNYAHRKPADAHPHLLAHHGHVHAFGLSGWMFEGFWCNRMLHNFFKKHERSQISLSLDLHALNVKLMHEHIFPFVSPKFISHVFHCFRTPQAVRYDEVCLFCLYVVYPSIHPSTCP